MSRPSELHLALALSVVRSKPAEVTVEEYIGQLRRHLEDRKRPESSHPGVQQFNGSAFWQSEYKRLYQSSLQMQGKTFELQRRNDALRATLEANHESAKATERGRKRKKMGVDPDTSVGRRSPKKASKATELVLSTMPALTDEADPLAGTPGHQTLLSSLYHIHKLCIQPEQGGALLAYHLSQASDRLSSALTCFGKARPGPSSKARASSDEGYNNASTTAIARAFTSLLFGLDALSKYEGYENLLGTVLHSISMFLSATLDKLDGLALSDAKLSMAVELAREPKTKAKAKDARSQRSAQTASPAIKSLTLLLCALVSQLDPAKAPHRAVFEAYLYLLLSRMGRVIYVFTFSHPRERNPADDIRRELNESNKFGSTNKSPAVETELRQSRLLAPYLLTLLSRAMSAAPSHMSSAKQECTEANGQEVPLMSVLSQAAQDRLQRTLIRCIFGLEGRSELDLTDVLRMPERGPDVVVPKIKGRNVGQLEMDSFLDGVWRLLGWEILGREIDWAETF